MGYNVKSIREDFKKKGIFYTPKPLAEYMKSFLPTDIDEVYDPTCGHGSLLDIFSDNIKKYGQDINPDAVAAASQIPNSEIVCGDTLTHPAFAGKKFRAIIANPPYSIKWNPDELKDDERFATAPCLPPKSKADFAFLLHILHYLSEDGVAVTMNFPGIGYRGQREGKIRRWFIEQNLIDTCIQIPGNQFVDTSVSQLILIIKKNRTTTDVRFINREDNVEHIVPVQEIIDNDFSLSVSLYAQKESKSEPIDVEQEENKARAALIDHVRKSLAFSYFVQIMSGISMKPLLSELQSVLDEYK